MCIIVRNHLVSSTFPLVQDKRQGLVKRLKEGSDKMYPRSLFIIYYCPCLTGNLYKPDKRWYHKSITPTTNGRHHIFQKCSKLSPTRCLLYISVHCTVQLKHPMWAFLYEKAWLDFFPSRKKDMWRIQSVPPQTILASSKAFVDKTKRS